MTVANTSRLVMYAVLSIILLACGGGGDGDSNSDSSITTSNSAGLPVDLGNFKTNALKEVVTTVDCTLSNGQVSSCYRLVASGPSDQVDVGPFCPPTTRSSAVEGGIWFDGGTEVYDLDGEFILGLADLYNDNNWLLYDAAGNVNITDTQEACDAAARPNVAEEYQNHCVECEVSYIAGGQPTATFLIPITPVARTAVGAVNSNAGVAFNGVTLNAPAPVNAILGAYTIAAFDECAGHVNLVAGYHYHGANGCSEGAAQADGHAASFAYAMDGYPIYSMLDTSGNESTDLDSCRGHSDDGRGYHYHAASAAENMFIGCFRGETAR